MRIKVETKNKTVSPDTKIYVLHAGLNRMFFRDFLESNRVFLQLPGLELPQEFQLDDEFKSRFQKANALSQFHLKNDLVEPPVGLENYHPTRGLEDSEYKKVDSQNLNAFFSFFMDMSPGDIILTPARGWDKPVLIGEIETEFDPIDTKALARFGGLRVPTRRIKWLRSDKSRLDLPPDLSLALHTPRAFTLLPESQKLNALDYAFEDYDFSESASIVIHIGPRDHELDPIDPLALRGSSDLILYLNALYTAVERDRVEEFYRMDFYAAIHSDFYRGSPLDAEYEIHSPGTVTYRSSVARRIAFIGAMLSLLAHPVLANESDPDIEIISGWEETPADCMDELRDSLHIGLQHADFERWNELCRKKAEAEEYLSIRVATSATIVEENGSVGGDEE